MRTLHRREILVLIGSGPLSLAGCVESGTETSPSNTESDDDDTAASNDDDTEPPKKNKTDQNDNNSENSTMDDADDDSNDDSPITSITIETTDTSGGTGGEDETDIEIDGDTIYIEGKRTASNPCHEAVVLNDEIDGNELTIGIGVESTLEEGEACMDVIGVIEYEVTVVLEKEDSVSAVVVEHPEML